VVVGVVQGAGKEDREILKKGWRNWPVPPTLLKYLGVVCYLHSFTSVWLP
jgi:hypothetical protein